MRHSISLKSAQMLPTKNFRQCFCTLYNFRSRLLDVFITCAYYVKDLHYTLAALIAYKTTCIAVNVSLQTSMQMAFSFEVYITCCSKLAKCKFGNVLEATIRCKPLFGAETKACCCKQSCLNALHCSP